MSYHRGSYSRELFQEREGGREKEVMSVMSVMSWHLLYPLYPGTGRMESTFSVLPVSNFLILILSVSGSYIRYESWEK